MNDKDKIEQEQEQELVFWSPDNEAAPIAEDLKTVDFKKDAKQTRLPPEQQHQLLAKTLRDLSSAAKDVENILTKTDPQDIKTSCGVEEKRAFDSYVELGRMVIILSNMEELDDAGFKNPTTIEMGKIWTHANYDHIQEADLKNLKIKNDQMLKKAFEDLSDMEDAWQDEKSERSLQNNQALVEKWLSNHLLPLIEKSREMTECVRRIRVRQEDLLDIPKYSSLGEALKAKDTEAFLKMLPINNYSKEKEDDVAVLNSLLGHTIKIAPPRVDEAIKALAELGANVNKTDNAGETLIMKALAEGKVDIARALRLAGALINEKTLDGYSEIMIAAREGQVESLKYLIEEAGVSPQDENYGINAETLMGYTALVLAVSENHKEATEYLLNQGANPNHEVWGVEFAVPEQFTEEEDILELLSEAQERIKLKPKSQM